MKVPTNIYSMIDHIQQKREKEMIPNSVATLKRIIDDVCKIFRTDKNKVFARGRAHDVIMCRRIYCFIATRYCPNIRLKFIADYGGGADHTWVIHHRDRAKELIEVDDAIFLGQWDFYITHTKLFTRLDFPEVRTRGKKIERYILPPSKFERIKDVYTNETGDKLIDRILNTPI